MGGDGTTFQIKLQNCVSLLLPISFDDIVSFLSLVKTTTYVVGVADAS